MPAPEIASAYAVVDRRQKAGRTDLSARNGPVKLGEQLRVAKHKSDHEKPVGPASGGKHSVAVLDRSCERLFAYDVFAGVDGLEGDVCVRKVGRGYHDYVDVWVVDECRDVVRGRFDFQRLRREGKPDRIIVDKGDNFRAIVKALTQVAAERIKPA